MYESDYSTVAVIMSTYNGELYLKEQLDSILTQDGVKVKIFIRDDGSTDITPEILSEYADKYNNVIFSNPDNRINLGVKDSFLSLLKEVSNNNPHIEYFAFADQDDVWKSDKLSAAVNMIEKQHADAQKPVLYYSNKTFVDKNLKTISEESIKYYGDFFEILWPSLASGCTMVFNRILAEYSVRNMPDDLFIHDSWVYRLAKVCGTNIVFDPQSHILYRQHNNNVCGISATKTLKLSSFVKLFSKRRHISQKMISELAELNGDIIMDACKISIETVLNYNKDIRSWLCLATEPLAFKRGVVMYLSWLARLLFLRL